MPVSVAHLDSRPIGDQDLRFRPRGVDNILSWRFDDEIFSTVIHSLSAYSRRAVVSLRRNSLGFREILVVGNPLLKSEGCL